MVTGLGGDELLATPASRHTARVTDPEFAVPWLGKRAKAALPELDTNLAPVAVRPLPTLMALALHNPSYLAAGIWPTAPLADPRLIRFAEQLPVRWRRANALFRCRLRQAGLPRSVTNPARPESFAPLMQHGLRHHGLPILRRMLDDSVLVDAGFLDHRRLTAAYHAATSASRLPSLLCDTMATELALRSLTRNPLRTRGPRPAP